MCLSRFIREERERILEDFEEFARTHTSPGEAMDIRALRDHAAGMLSAIALDECRALRASVLRLWTDEHGALDGTDLQDLIRFNETEPWSRHRACPDNLRPRTDRVPTATPQGVAHARQAAEPLRLMSGLLTLAILCGCEHSVVSVVEVSEIELSPPEITLVEGERDTVSVVLRGSGGSEVSGREVTWTVDDEEVASVTSEGVVEGRRPGATRVRATSEGVSGDAEITVVPGPDAEPEPETEDSCDIRDRTLGDDVEIARDRTCTFTNVRIRGDLELGRGARLIAEELRVDGDLEADGAEELKLTRSWIGGDVAFEKGGRVTILETRVGGKVEIKESRGRIDLRDNTVNDDVKLEKNREGPFTLFRNRIDGKLECKDNVPAPTGSGNVVGEKEGGQCRNLATSGS
jgi:hypothetical protein